MTKKYTAADILNHLENIDEKSFNHIYKELDKKEREKVDQGLIEYTEEQSLDSNYSNKK